MWRLIFILSERVAIDQVRVLHVPMTSQFADIFTKGLPSSVFNEIQSSLNIYSELGFFLRMYSPVHIGWCAAPSLGPPGVSPPPSEGFPPCPHIVV
jgi:hypothetical protein